VSHTIAPLAVRDVDALCTLARTIWRQHYPPIIGAAQTEYMLAQRYDAAVIRAELDRGDVWWDTLSENGSMVAFASYFAVEPGRTIKLDKLYVHPEHQGRGYGGALLEHVCRRANVLGCSKVVLAVNKRNASAIGAYRKHGFTIAEAVVKDIGGGFVMDDYIMQREVRSEAREADGGKRELRSDAS
jgi:ribosomal protein S18 acetylase RimI-like enzyme